MLRRISDGSIQRSIHSSGKTSQKLDSEGDQDKEGKEHAGKVVLVPFIKLVRSVEQIMLAFNHC